MVGEGLHGLLDDHDQRLPGGGVGAAASDGRVRQLQWWGCLPEQSVLSEHVQCGVPLELCVFESSSRDEVSATVDELPAASDLPAGGRAAVLVGCGAFFTDRCRHQLMGY